MGARTALVLGLAALALAGCGGAYVGAREAMRQGRYAEAASGFEEALARDPDRVDALVGLGVAKYRIGAWDEAIAPLGRAVSREPGLTVARLYLGLAHLRQGEDGPVEEHLGAVMAQQRGTRLAAQADRALRVLRGADPVSEDMRVFIAGSLEAESEASREIAEVRRQLREAEFRWRDPYYASPLLYRSRCRC